MTANKQLKLNHLFATDDNASYMRTLVASGTKHLLKRQHQRAITNSMVRIAILYGHQEFIGGQQVFTLTDKALEGTPCYPSIYLVILLYAVIKSLKLSDTPC